MGDIIISCPTCNETYCISKGYPFFLCPNCGFENIMCPDCGSFEVDFEEGIDNNDWIICKKCKYQAPLWLRN